jgi:hypothetical protein
MKGQGNRLMIVCPHCKQAFPSRKARSSHYRLAHRQPRPVSGENAIETPKRTAAREKQAL